MNDINSTQFNSIQREQQSVVERNDASGSFTDLVSLPQDGGVKQTSPQELVQQSKTTDPRVKALFGNAELSNAAQLRPNFQASGRSEYARSNDQQAIAGIDALVKNGTIDKNTIVIMDGGHSADGLLRLTDHPELKVQGAYHNVYKSFPDDPARDNFSGSGRAENNLNDIQTYQDKINQRTSQNGGGGTVYFGIDAHGKKPSDSLLPDPDKIKEVMGSNVKVVVLSELPTGTTFDPTNAKSGPTMQNAAWYQKLKDAGIPVQGYGVDSRPKDDNPLGGGMSMPRMRRSQPMPYQF